MRLKTKSLCVILAFVLLFIGGNGVRTDAYVKTGYAFSNPDSIVFKTSSTAGQYSSIISTYTKKWNTYCSEVTLKSGTSNENIYFYAQLSYDNGTYAVTNRSSKDYYSITFYKSFNSATSAQKNETIVHEVGHALGLAHCQSSKNSISVMRATGFNGKAYPLSDDISGISAIY